MSEDLYRLLDDGIIEDVVGRLKTGKEAEVWTVLYEGREVAAKIYKDRAQRSFKNNADYLEGRKTRNSRTRRAMEKGSRFGQKAAEDAWKESEANALYRLHAAGVRVPTPHLYYEGILLMELVQGPDGGPAPRLIELKLSAEQAAAIYADLRGQIIRMLCADLIHGDLSPYNILLGEQGPVIIDLPQTVDAAANNRAASFFHRDVDNVRNFLATFDRSLHGRRKEGRAIWKAWQKRELTPDFEPPAAPAAAPAAGPKVETLSLEPKRPRRRGRGGRGGRAGKGSPVVVEVTRVPGIGPKRSERR